MTAPAESPFAPPAVAPASSSGPSAAEMISFEELWPDRSKRQRYEGRLMTHDEQIRARWGLSETRYRQLLFHALGYELDACLKVDAETSYRLLAVAARQSKARGDRTPAGLS